MTRRDIIAGIVYYTSISFIVTAAGGSIIAELIYSSSIVRDCTYCATNGCLSECNCLWCHNDTLSLCTKSINYNKCNGMNITKSPQCEGNNIGYVVTTILVCVELLVNIACIIALYIIDKRVIAVA